MLITEQKDVVAVTIYKAYKFRLYPTTEHASINILYEGINKYFKEQYSN